jgi:hypothetical protein
MYDENCAERWESGMKPFSNEWEYLTKNIDWLEKEFYHKEARDWRYGTVWDKQFDRNHILDLTDTTERREKNDSQIRHEDKIFRGIE